MAKTLKTHNSNKNSQNCKMSMEFIFEAILVVITGSFGIAGNAVLISWFATLRNKLNFHYLMITLAAFDSFYIITCILVFSVPPFFAGEQIEAYYCYLVPKAIPIIQIALTGTIYCTGAISVERYLTVCHPFYTKQKHWAAKRYILPIIVLSLVYNIPRFFEMQTKVTEVQIIRNSNETRRIETPLLELNNFIIPQKVDIENEDKFHNSNMPFRELLHAGNESLLTRRFAYRLELTNLRNSTYYYSAYTIGLNFFLMGVFPFALIITLNVLMYRQLMRILSDPYNQIRKCSIVSFDSNAGFRLRRGSVYKRIKLCDVVLAKFSLLIVAVFVVCHSIRWIPNVYELMQRVSHSDNSIEWPAWVENVTNVSHFVTVLNSSVNFYIYYLTHQGIPICMCVSSSNIEMRNV